MKLNHKILLIAVLPIFSTLQFTSAIAETELHDSAAVKQLSKEDVDKLLAERLDGGMGYSFKQFANMFFVSSHLAFGKSVGLVSSSEKISKTILQSPFPRTYRPTLREFLDAIALQTSSQWKYNPTGKYMRNKIGHKQKSAEMAVFEFSEQERTKPYEITLAKGWTSTNKGNWTMFSPPEFPVGLDIYEMGTYSASSKSAEDELFKTIPKDVAMEWAKRVSPKAKADDFKTAKVGEYDCIFFESIVKSQIKKDVHWRQWVFMVGNKCYFIVSSILPELESKIYPDVEAMLKTFRIAK